MTVFTIQKDDKTCGVFNAVTPLLTFIYQYAEDFGFDDGGKNFNEIAVTELDEELNKCMVNAKVISYELNCDYYADKDNFRYGKDVQTNAKADQHFIWTAQMLDGTNFTVTAPYKPMAVEAAIMQHINEKDIYSGVDIIKKQDD